MKFKKTIPGEYLTYPEDRTQVIFREASGDYVLCNYVNGQFFKIDLWSYGERESAIECIDGNEWCYLSDFVKTLLIQTKE